MYKRISFTLNGKKVNSEVDVRKSLLEVLRDMGLTGVKKGCGVGECGACTVLINEIPMDSCLYLAVWANGQEIRTIEGIAENGELSKVQKAFVEEGAIQCGFCTPGLVLTTTALAESGKNYNREELKRELSGHICRCTGYQKIVSAAEKAIAEEHECHCKEHHEE
ncbi:xanthine dehydrogenase subunit XdhC [Desulfitobacterium sp. Sab5]|uniref:xanthine dehydrogenase subunit XdhC n=1 Tax=Desulfitobacterium nosdiversum TaxID=3375356 RepID=UPI003CF86C70